MAACVDDGGAAEKPPLGGLAGGRPMDTEERKEALTEECVRERKSVCVEGSSPMDTQGTSTVLAWGY